MEDESMVSTIEVTPTQEAPQRRAKARPARETKAQMRARMARLRAAKFAKNNAIVEDSVTKYQCSKCNRVFENERGLNTHIARPGKFHSRRAKPVSARQNTPKKSFDISQLQEKWMTDAANQQGPVRKAILECVLDLMMASRT